MAESADPLDGDEIAWVGLGVSQRVERRDTSTQEWSRLDGSERVGDRADGLRRDGRVLGVPAVESTATRTSAADGSGIGTSTASNGSPAAGTRIARIVSVVTYSSARARP